MLVNNAEYYLSGLLEYTSDVSDEAQVVDVVQQTQAKFGKVDILVNNAGVMLLGKIDGANTEDWRRMMKLNSPYGTRAVIKEKTMNINRNDTAVAVIDGH